MTAGIPSIRLRRFGMRFSGCIEIAGDQQVEAVGEALVVSERVPILLLQLLEIEDLVIDAVFQDAQVDAVRRAQLRLRRRSC